MSFSYYTDVTRDLDKVRLMMGDTNEDNFQLHDGEILYVLGSVDDITEAAISCARIVAGKFSKLADTKVGEESTSYSQLSEQYWELADRLSQDASIRAGISAGGTAIEGVGGEDPAFTRALHMCNTTPSSETSS